MLMSILEDMFSTLSKGCRVENKNKIDGIKFIRVSSSKILSVKLCVKLSTGKIKVLKPKKCCESFSDFNIFTITKAAKKLINKNAIPL